MYLRGVTDMSIPPKSYSMHTEKRNSSNLRILLVGVAGCGKRFLLSKLDGFAMRKKVFSSSYSNLLVKQLEKSAGMVVSSGDLRNLEHNVLLRAKLAVNNKLSKIEDWIISTQICYKNDDNYIFSIDPISKLCVNTIIHVSSTPNEICIRRAEKSDRLYPQESESDILFHQNVSESISKLIADRFGLTYLLINNSYNNVEENIKILKGLIERSGDVGNGKKKQK